MIQISPFEISIVVSLTLVLISWYFAITKDLIIQMLITDLLLGGILIFVLFFTGKFDESLKWYLVPLIFVFGFALPLFAAYLFEAWFSSQERGLFDDYRF